MCDYLFHCSDSRSKHTAEWESARLPGAQRKNKALGSPGQRAAAYSALSALGSNQQALFTVLGGESAFAELGSRRRAIQCTEMMGPGLSVETEVGRPPGSPRTRRRQSFPVEPHAVTSPESARLAGSLLLNDTTN